MDAKALKTIVDNFGMWNGNTYTLAALIASEQREKDALKADDAGYPDLADEIRGG